MIVAARDFSKVFLLSFVDFLISFNLPRYCNLEKKRKGKKTVDMKNATKSEQEKKV